MAKTKAPLFSLEATGTLDKNITYKGKKQNNIAQKYSKPGAVNPFESSPRQKDQRSIIRLITIHWQCMSSSEKLSWEVAAKDKRFKGSGYHYFLHMAQQNLTQYLGLVGYWSMNYNIDEKIPDLSGNGNHGTLSPIYPCDCPTFVKSINNKFGEAISCNGTSTYIDTGYPVLPLNTWTLSAFIKSELSGTKGSLFGQYAPAQPGRVNLLVTSLGAIQFQVGAIFYSPIAVFPKDIWTHISFTKEGTSGHIYINGVDVGNGLLDLNTYQLAYFEIAKSDRFGLNIFDDVTIYNRVLSPKEITLLSTIYQSK